MHGLEGELERRTVTYTVWNESVAKMENKGWHPMTFGYAYASPERIREIKVIFCCLIFLISWNISSFWSIYLAFVDLFSFNIIII